MKSLAATILFSTCLAFLINAGCAVDKEQSVLGDEIKMLEQKLEDGVSFAQACVELEVLCDASGFGCQAHELFCKVPTKDYICQQLAAACVNTPAACDVYNSHCGSHTANDAGPMQRDYGDCNRGCNPDFKDDDSEYWDRCCKALECNLPCYDDLKDEDPEYWKRCCEEERDAGVATPDQIVNRDGTPDMGEENNFTCAQECPLCDNDPECCEECCETCAIPDAS